MGKIKKRAGFTLIEVTIAIFILIVIIGSVFALASSSSTNLRESEAKNIAKNIATYTVEYIRSRNVTTDNIPKDAIIVSNGNTSDPKYDFGNDSSHYYPGLIDLWGAPVNSNGCANEGGDKYINVKPALPDEKYGTNGTSYLAFYYSLQGYVSLGDFDHLSPSDPSPEDANARIESDDCYHDKVTVGVSNPHGNIYIMRFPFNSTKNSGADPNPDAIKNFTALSGYNCKIYTTDPNKLEDTKPEYDPHYINTDKKDCMAYRGFRVLTSIAARAKENPDNPGYLPPSPHVQYYDVKVTVFWITGSNEQSYSILTQLVTY